MQALNARSAASLSAGIVTTLRQGEAITVVSAPVSADGYSWYQVQRGGACLGWSLNGFVLGGSPTTPTTPTTSTPTPTVPNPTTPTTPPAGGYGYGASVTVTASPLNVRALPSITAQILTVYANGRVARITGEPRVADNRTWYPVDNLGWVSEEDLRAGDGITAPTTPAPPTTTVTPGGASSGLKWRR